MALTSRQPSSFQTPAGQNPHHISVSTWQYPSNQRKEVVRLGKAFGTLEVAER